MNKQTLVFYRLGNFSNDFSMGSVYRVNTIEAALKNQDLSLEVIHGNGSERVMRLKALIKRHRAGEVSLYGLYGESSNLTILLSNEKYNLFAGLREMYLLYKLSTDIPVSLFYRDCYWKVLGIHKNMSLKYLYKYIAHKFEWFLYRGLVKLLYVPSIEFSKYLRHGKYAIKALPPGVVSREFALSEKKGKLKLLYVGGCKPPYYDITNLFRCNNVLVSDIIIVTRENEWNLNKNFYNSLSNKVIVKHLSGEKLDMLYAEVDIFIDLREAWGNDYFKSSMPLKFFEALGFGKPIILMKGSVVADLIQEYKLGFVLNNIDELDSALSFVRENYTNIQGNILRFNSFNTWDSRAEQIINDLKCI